MTISKKINMETRGMFFTQDHFPVVHASMKPFLETEFYGTDNKEDFDINIKRLPQDWRYRNETIQYRFNGSGLRMNKELAEVNESYLIGFGCSHTLGVGINEEDTWVHLLANNMSLDYINAGVSGGSAKLCAINFFNLLATNRPLPRAVVFAWPSSVRYCLYAEDQFLFYLPRFIDEDFRAEGEIYKSMLMCDALDHEFIFYRNMVISTCNRLRIPYNEFTFDDKDDVYRKLDIELIYTDIKNRNLNTDYARDIRDKSDQNRFSHPGTGLHLRAADFLSTRFSTQGIDLY